MATSKRKSNLIYNYINGELLEPIDGEYFDNINPATGAVYSEIPDSNDKDVMIATEAAETAFEDWSNTKVETRSRIMLRIADLIEQNLDNLALAECNDNGKPLSLAKSIDIPRASANFRFFANGIVHFSSSAHVMEDTGFNYTIRKPVGIAGCISPWNLPLYLFTWKIAPAIAVHRSRFHQPKPRKTADRDGGRAQRRLGLQPKPVRGIPAPSTVCPGTIGRWRRNPPPRPAPAHGAPAHYNATWISRNIRPTE